MSKGPANFRQSDVERAIRAGKRLGVRSVEFTCPKTGAVIRFRLGEEPDSPPETSAATLAEREPLVF